MRCPSCNLPQSTNCKVVETRRKEDGNTIRRRRECLCGYRFTTYERLGDEKEKRNGGLSKFTDNQIINIYRLRDWYTTQELADLFDVHYDTIRRIKNKVRKVLENEPDLHNCQDGLAQLVREEAVSKQDPKLN